jgi:diguanylate cyclase (GGDEF)-like protein
MGTTEPAHGHPHGALLVRLLWPTALLFGTTFALVVVTFLWTARDADRVSDMFDRARLEAAVQQLTSELQDELTTFAAAPDGTADEATLRFNGLALVSPTGIPLGGAGAWHRPPDSGLQAVLPSIRDVAASLHASGPLALRRTPAIGTAATRLVAVGESAVVVSAVVTDEAGTVLAGWKRLDGHLFARMSTITGLRDLTLGDADEARTHDPSRESEGHLELVDHEGQPRLHLDWTRMPVGGAVQQRLGPVVVASLAAAMLLFAAVVAYYFWITRHLVEAEAASKAVLARDPLSGLPNRALFNDRLDRELRHLADRGVGLAVMFIDLDRFKDVNDTYGHQAGDELIKLVAQRLLGELPDVDTLARFGGDEFAIIQTNVRDVAQVSDLAARILAALGRPFELAHSQVTIGTSIGVALAPEQATDRHSLLKLADTALYQAKNGGRNRMSLFQRHMDETIRMRKMVEEDLRAAIENDGLALHYQPLMSADGETIVGVEALVRWPHPTRGLISPAEFIPVAEERGLVIPLEEWVLRRACRDGQRWPGLTIAVNVSPIQFRHREYVSTVKRVLQETGFDPGRLELELTEGVLVTDADAAEAAMMDLRGLGVNLALDDFGTGYSSLIYLRRFAFDKIKIDRSFLESMEATGESAILVHSIVHLGRALGLIVLAEGVETREQHRFLQALGCHQLQGFLFSPAVPASEIDRMLAPGARLLSTAA